jgi:NADH dehydrogenase
MMGSLGHSKAFGQMLGLRTYGTFAWVVRRSYYLMQTPGWGRRLRIMVDWAFALLFRPEVGKIDLENEKDLLPHKAPDGELTGAVPR